jgi:hypothetical protein
MDLAVLEVLMEIIVEEHMVEAVAVQVLILEQQQVEQVV